MIYDKNKNTEKYFSIDKNLDRSNGKRGVKKAVIKIKVPKENA